MARSHYAFFRGCRCVACVFPVTFFADSDSTRVRLPHTHNYSNYTATSKMQVDNREQSTDTSCSPPAIKKVSISRVHDRAVDVFTKVHQLASILYYTIHVHDPHGADCSPVQGAHCWAAAAAFSSGISSGVLHCPLPVVRLSYRVRPDLVLITFQSPATRGQAWDQPQWQRQLLPCSSRARYQGSRTGPRRPCRAGLRWASPR